MLHSGLGNWTVLGLEFMTRGYAIQGYRVTEPLKVAKFNRFFLRVEKASDGLGNTQHKVQIQIH